MLILMMIQTCTKSQHIIREYPKIFQIFLAFTLVHFFISLVNTNIRFGVGIGGVQLQQTKVGWVGLGQVLYFYRTHVWCKWWIYNVI